MRNIEQTENLPEDQERLISALKARLLREKYAFLNCVETCSQRKQYDLLNKIIIDLATLQINSNHTINKQLSWHNNNTRTQCIKIASVVAGSASILLIVAGMIMMGMSYQTEKDDKNTNEKALRYAMISIILGMGAGVLANIFTIFSNQISAAYNASEKQQEKVLARNNLTIQCHNETSKIVDNFVTKTSHAPICTYAIDPESAPGLQKYEEHAKALDKLQKTTLCSKQLVSKLFDFMEDQESYNLVMTSLSNAYDDIEQTLELVNNKIAELKSSDTPLLLELPRGAPPPSAKPPARTSASVTAGETLRESDQKSKKSKKQKKRRAGSRSAVPDSL